YSMFVFFLFFFFFQAEDGIRDRNVTGVQTCALPILGKPVICEHCLAEITDKRDLVTASFFIFIVPYHAYCYSQGLKGVKTFILNNYPLNGAAGNFSAITA